MRKELSSDLVLYFSDLYPRSFGQNGMSHRALLGIGGNIGAVRRRFHKLLAILRHHPRINVLATAPILKNPPFGFLDQPDFFNSLIEVETSFSPKELLHFCFWLEKRFKRRRTFKNAPRTLDVDIIFYDDIHIDTKDLQIPHPHWFERESVIIPLRFLEGGR